MQIGSQPYPFSSISLQGLGKVAVGLTATKIQFTSQVKVMTISSLPENTARIYIGKSGLLSNGTNASWYLDPGDDLTMDYDSNGESIYICAELDAQTVIIGGSL